jgi:hypothetical protein
MVGFIYTLFTHYRNYRQYSAIADLHTLQFIVTHALGFSAFTSLIQATDFIRVCHFKSYMKSSLRRLIPFLPLFCNCQLSSIPLLPRSYQSRLASRNSTLQFTARPQLNSSLQPFFTDHTENTPSLLLRRRVYYAVA